LNLRRSFNYGQTARNATIIFGDVVVRAKPERFVRAKAE
jgi:hypothetical protein